MNNSTRCQLLFQLADQEYFTTDEFVNCISDIDTPVEIVIVGLVLITLTLLTAGGNLLIGLAILLVRRLRNPANLLILNLALADFLISVLVLPFAIAYQLKGYWPFGQQVCNVFLLLDVLLCTASILNLCAISVDRYLAITKPLNYAASRTSKRMLWMIIICWLMAALISIPPVLSFKKTINETYCSYSEDLAYQVYATFSAFFIPLLVMLVLYGRIYVIVRRLALQDAMIITNMSKYVGNGPTAPEETNQNRNPLSPTVIKSDSHTNATETTAPSPSSNYLSPDYQLQLSQSKQSIRICTDNCSTFIIQGRGNSSDTKAQEQLNNNHKSNESRRSTIRPQLFSLLRGRLSNRNSSVEQASQRKTALHSTENMKAVITLGVIMGSFTLCWLPFFICQVSYFNCLRLSEYIYVILNYTN
ncbi:hypothetical protein EG68_00912 [Paragonimus skrjabini miyazakii]|uniref:G-protein coupled receptors family 1 profile domain-containing protein n=1 Tax=Paragonimus skrjabini miyazakii TaxID=59628 RepID=A0A8S9Z5H5_9TREM|nr:hypothetical protein EG68_00912 [Paragonimus skrjabini miyazakii]